MPIRCDAWIIECVTDQPTNQPTDTASYRGAFTHLSWVAVMFLWISHHIHENASDQTLTQILTIKPASRDEYP